jgi:hypothetical protein
MAVINLTVRLARKRKKDFRKDLNRLIDAVGFLGHVVSQGFVSPGPAASTDFSKLTSTAFSLIAVGVPKVPEDFRAGPDLLERFLSHISTIQFEIAAGLNLPHMGDETEGDPSETSPCHRIESILLGSDFFPLFFGLLPEDAIVMGSAGGFEL